MPAGGGVPQRVTYTATLNRDDVSDRMGPNNICMGWKDKETIVYRSRWRDFNDWKGQLYTANINGSMPEQLPFPHGGFAVILRIKRKSHSTECLENSEPGNVTKVARQMRSGSMILLPNKPLKLQTTMHRTSSRCGPVIKFITCLIATKE